MKNLFLEQSYKPVVYKYSIIIFLTKPLENIVRLVDMVLQTYFITDSIIHVTIFLKTMDVLAF